jgi:pimeloyl-ACP methyl ester carboxylesterase
MARATGWRTGTLGLVLASALFLWSGAPALTLAPAAPVEPGRRVVVTVPGKPPVSLYVEEHGAGEPILLLHGLGESSYTWHEIAPGLAARHRVLALDLKGFGRSEKPDDDAYGADDQAALVARFILDAGLDRVTLIGHSFGGTVALRTALADGIAGTGRVRRIAVIAAPALPRTAARRFDLVNLPLIPDALAAALPADTMVRLLLREAMGGRTASEADVEGYAAPYREEGAMRAFFATARAIVAETDVRAAARRYRALKQPVLAVWCRKDPIVPLRAGRDLVAVLPSARLAVLDGCHHLPQHERPKQLLRTLAAFLTR